MKKENIFRIVLFACAIFFTVQFGFKPTLSGKEKPGEPIGRDWSEQLSKNRSTDYDIVVFGAEPQGISAALSAARLGARTLLISEDDDLGGIISDCLIPELEIPYDNEGKMLNGGLLEELNKKLGVSFSEEAYLNEIKKLTDGEENIEALYNVSISNAVISGAYLNSLELASENGQRTVSARMFIDASDGGNLLEVCKVPFFTGSADLNMKDSYMPVSLNFEMELSGGAGTDSPAIDKLTAGAGFKDKLGRYETLSNNAGLDDLSVFVADENKVVVGGLKISGVDVTDGKALEDAYETAVNEAQNLARFLSDNFRELRDYTYLKPARALRIRESKHYSGKYVLTVNDIIDNRYFTETVAMGSYPVLIGKFALKGSFVAGKGSQYGIPIGCLVPEGISNLLMAGPRASYSSLAASSAGTIGTSIAAGEAAGALAVFCAAKNENPAFINSEHLQFADFKSLLSEKKMYLPEKAITDEYKDNWSYPSARKLVALGLVAGGSDNNLRYGEQSSQKDLAFILINGIHRMDNSLYTVELNARLRPFISNGSLTFDSAVAMLGALYSIEGDTDSVYKKLCEQHGINELMQQRLKERDILSMDEVYYLGVYSIQNFTGKEISG